MRFGNSTILAAIGEDLPEEHNRVELDPDLTDAHGIAAPKVLYKLSENSARQMAHAVANGERCCGRPARARLCRPRCCGAEGGT